MKYPLFLGFFGALVGAAIGVFVASFVLKTSDPLLGYGTVAAFAAIGTFISVRRL